MLYRQTLTELYEPALSVGVGSNAAQAENLHLKVVSDGNEPVPSAEVTLGYATRLTDQNGGLQVEVPRSGEYQVIIRWNNTRSFCDVSTEREKTCVIRDER